ncbi:MAG: PD-(D/E)XK nuclease family protein [Actinoplanes sp.]
MAADKEIMKQIETLRLDRPGRMHGAASATLEVQLVGAILIAALFELATTYLEEAELWAKSGAKGWKGNETNCATIAQAVNEVAAQLDNAGGGAALSVGLTEPATTHERLDALVSAAVAEGRGMLRDEPWDPNDAGDSVTGVAFTDVAAYLKGEVSDLPGGPLTPGSVKSLAELRVEGGDNDDVTGDDQRASILDAAGDFTETEAAARLATLPDFSATMTITGPAENGILPVTWESDTMTPDGTRLPGAPIAPTLGQPGDNSGGGYSHDYVPPGGRKLTFADLLTPVPAASLPPHLSHSQGNTINDCAAKYRMQRVEQLPQIPQWANIGGTAFHAAVEAFERTVAKMSRDLGGKPLNWATYDTELVWKHHFEQTISEVAATTTVPRSVWRSSRKGAEGEAWWWVNGPKFLRAYLDARPADVTWAPVGEPAIEIERTIDVPTPYGPIPFTAKIDRVTYDERTDAYILRDYKTSYERPTDTTQLGDYAWALILAKQIFADRPILGSYFDARRGTWTEPVDLLAAHPFEAFQYRVTTAHAQKLALTDGPTPARPSSFCGGCSVRYACPVMASKN